VDNQQCPLPAGANRARNPSIWHKELFVCLCNIQVMNERDVLDLILVAIVAVVTYIETFGLTGPLSALQQIIAVLASLDIKVYLVLGGLFGVFFLAYLTIYLPKQEAKRSMQRHSR
jgi:hypothetical protein